jgi:hypothetical protein
MNIFPSLKLHGLAVSIMGKLWAGRSGVRISTGARDFFFSCPKRPDRLFGGMGTGFSFPGGIAAGACGCILTSSECGD